MKNLLYFLVFLTLNSCKKEQTKINSYYTDYVGKWAYCGATYFDGYNYVFSGCSVSDRYVIEFLEGREVNIWFYDSLLTSGHIYKLDVSSHFISFEFESKDGVKYNSRLNKDVDSLWSKYADPGPLYPNPASNVYESFFYKVD